MAIIDRQWLNANEGRNYPLTDLATRVSDDGVVLPNALITDIYIRVPYSTYKEVYISSASVGPGVVSLVFSSLDPSATVPLGSVTVAKPVTPYKNYAIEEITSGVGGWVSFGQYAKNGESFNAKFSALAQSQLLDRCVNVYDVLPVTGIRKRYAADSLTGLVRLAGRVGSTQTVKGQRTINGRVKDVILVQVISGTDLTQKLKDLAGVCGHRPAENTCNKRVLTAVNDITPDCNGNIDLEFRNGIIVGEVPHGLVLDYPKGLAAACVKIDPNKLPSETEDVCHPSSEPVPPEPSSSSYAPSSIVPVDPEYCETFTTSPTELVVAVDQNSNPIGGFTLESGWWKSTNGSGNNYARDNQRSLVSPYKYALKCTVRPAISGEGHLVFDANTDSSGYHSYKFAGVVTEGYSKPIYANKFVIGSFNSLSATTTNNLGYFHSVTDVIDPGMSLPGDADYDLYLYVEEIGGQIVITFDAVWSGGSVHFQKQTALYQPSYAFGGLGALTANTYFDFFGENCESSSSLVP